MKTKRLMNKGVSRILFAALLLGSGGAFAATENDVGTTTTFAVTGGVSGSGAITKVGTTITNDALLDYKVSSVSQNQIAASDQGNEATFVVDRLLDVDVTRAGSTKYAAPGAVATLAFDVTNESNDDTLDLKLRVAQITADVDSLGTSQVTTASTLGTACIDNDASGTCNAGDTTLSGSAGAYTVAAAQAVPGTTLRILVEATTDLDAVQGEYDSFVLAAGLAEGGGAQIVTDDNGNFVTGGATAGTTADGASTVEDVFGDAPGTDGVNISSGAVSGSDVQSDGQNSDRDQLQIDTADLTVTKTSEVIYDPVVGLKCDLDSATAGTTDYAVCDTSTPVVEPHAIPGAIVRYVISVSNASTTVGAEEVSITDNVPASVNQGNDSAVSGLVAGVCDGTSATGLTAGGGTCTGDPAAYLNNMVITSCDGVVTAAADTNPISQSLATGASTCDSGETGTIVYFVTIP